MMVQETGHQLHQLRGYIHYINQKLRPLLQVCHGLHKAAFVYTLQNARNGTKP